MGRPAAHPALSPLAEAGASGPAPRAGDVMNVPNVITFARLCAVPFAVWLVLHRHFGWTLGVFAAAGVSDGVDGFLARRRGGTALGAALDPLADKALLVGMFVTLGAMGMLPDWMVILVVFRDLVILGGIGLMWWLGHRVRIRPLLIGKANTALQIVLVGVTLLLAAVGTEPPMVLDALTWLTAAVTVASGAVYVVRAAQSL